MIFFSTDYFLPTSVMIIQLLQPSIVVLRTVVFSFAGHYFFSVELFASMGDAGHKMLQTKREKHESEVLHRTYFEQ